MIIENILIYALNMAFGCVGALFVARFAYMVGLIDRPNGRSSHLAPTPKGGAIGILIGFLVTAAYLDLSFCFWFPTGFLSVVSLLGDRYDIAPKVRFWIQFSCALIFLVGLFNLKNIHFLSFCLVLPLAVFITGTSNFYNFMDGINGIAGITGVVGFFLLMNFGILTDADSKYVAISIAITCSCLGFLPYNIPKAKVFMGDVGSILLGFVFACLVVILSRSFLDFICLAGFLFPFYADELTTMFVRIKAGESLSKPHRRHLYQILANECGIDHWKISAGYGVVQLIIGIVLIASRTEWNVVLVFLILCFLVFSLVSLLFRRHATYGYVAQIGVK